MVRALMQTALRAVFPPECLACRDLVETEFGLCGACRGQTAFIGGAVCECCGVPQLGPVEEGIVCDACMERPREWSRGRAALEYGGTAKQLVLALKHGDRQDIAGPAGHWMAQATRPIVVPNMLVAPVPLHWMRLAKRRYNQSALLGKSLAQSLDLTFCPDLLIRNKRTQSLEGQSPQERRDTMQDVLSLNPRRRHRIAGQRPVLLIDDVLTSGATLDACARVLKESGAGQICVSVLARAAKGP